MGSTLRNVLEDKSGGRGGAEGRSVSFGHQLLG